MEKFSCKRKTCNDAVKSTAPLQVLCFDYTETRKNEKNIFSCGDVRNFLRIWKRFQHFSLSFLNPTGFFTTFPAQGFS